MRDWTRSIKQAGAATLAACTLGLTHTAPIELPLLSSKIDIVSAAIADDSVEGESISTKLTAAEVLKSDITPRVDALKDILFVLKLNPSYIDNKDYDALRSALRSEPAVELRKTCTKLKKYLPADQVAPFMKAYDSMIDSLNDLDSLALKRTQGTGVPGKDEPDTTMLEASNTAVVKYEAMLKTIGAM